MSISKFILASGIATTLQHFDHTDRTWVLRVGRRQAGCRGSGGSWREETSSARFRQRLEGASPLLTESLHNVILFGSYYLYTTTLYVVCEYCTSVSEFIFILYLYSYVQYCIEYLYVQCEL